MTSVGTMTETGLRVLIADENKDALQSLHEALTELGHDVVPYAVSVAEAATLISREDPDIAIVVFHKDDEHALALIGEAVEYATGPVIAQVPDADVDFLSRAAERGISAYAESNDPESIQGAIEVAIRRHREASRLNAKVDQLEGAMERRALIERAKGILMERHGVDAEAAFELLRTASRTDNRKLADLAAAVAEGHRLLPKQAAGRFARGDEP
jgi:AmiR/NasT family two-component response regulator